MKKMGLVLLVHSSKLFVIWHSWKGIGISGSIALQHYIFVACMMPYNFKVVAMPILVLIKILARSML